MAAQWNKALDNLETVLKQAGMDLSNVVRLNYYTTDVDAFMGAYEAGVSRLAQVGCRPASTLLGVQRLFLPTLIDRARGAGGGVGVVSGRAALGLTDA